jgi:hypothetical protein
MWSRTRSKFLSLMHIQEKRSLAKSENGLHYACTAPVPKSRFKCSLPFAVVAKKRQGEYETLPESITILGSTGRHEAVGQKAPQRK